MEVEIARSLQISSGMTRAEIASAVEKIVAAVALKNGLLERSGFITLDTNLQDDLGMDEVDLMEVLFRAEKRFGAISPDHIDASSSVSDIVDFIAERVSEQEAPAVPSRTSIAVLESSPGLVPEEASSGSP